MGNMVFDISMSLDGFITGADARPEEGLGEGGQRLHNWGFNNPEPRSQEFMDWYARVGVCIFGRTGYDHSIKYWGSDGPGGPARIPTIIVSHSIPQNVPANHVYTFVDGIDAAMETAKHLAGDRDIYITGANVARQFLQRGLLDEISIHLVPVLFGSGTRLFEHLGSEHIELKPIEASKTEDAIHLRFQVPRTV